MELQSIIKLENGVKRNVFFVLFVMSDKEEFAGTAIASEGLWQRLNLICMYLPLFIVAVNGIMKE